MAEPSPVRDLGPFTDSTQAMRQYEAQMHGIPGALRMGALMVVAEACLLAGLELTEHEQAVIAGTMSSEAAVIVAGLILRAKLRAEDSGLANLEQVVRRLDP